MEQTCSYIRRVALGGVAACQDATFVPNIHAHQGKLQPAVEGGILIDHQGQILLQNTNCGWNQKVHYIYYLSQVHYPLCELWSQINHQKQGDTEVRCIQLRGYEHLQPIWSVHRRNQ